MTTTASTFAPRVPGLALAENKGNFDVHDVIRDALAQTSLTDPAAIASEICDQIAAHDLRAALRSLLRRAVADEQRLHRSHVGASAGSGKSRAQQVASWYAEVLATVVHIGDSERKTFGACTVADLDFIITERREIARKNAAVAARYERVRQAVTAKRVATVEQLGEDELRRAWGE